MASPISGQGNGIESHLVSEDRLNKNRETQAANAVGKIKQESGKEGLVQSDKIELSDDAKNLAKYQQEPLQLADGQYSVTDKAPEGATTLTMAKATTQSGRTLTINKVMTGASENNEGGNFFGFQANVYKPDGKLEYSFFLQKDTIFSENADGSLNVQDYVKGAETDGDDIIIGQEGKDLSGGKGNDTIVDLYSEKNQNGQDGISSSIDGGDGDDTIIAKGGMHNKTVTTGAGNDTIKVDGSIGNSSIDTGAGDDNIIVSGNFSSVTGTDIKMGDGADSLNMTGENAELNGTIDTGAGDDSINMAKGGKVNGDVNTGAGADNISVRKGRIDGDIKTGSGDDNVVTGLFAGTIDTGSGNDTIKAENVSGDINTGAGDDTLKVGEGGIGSSNISMGAGDDVLDAKNGDVHFSTINTGSGNDTVTVMDTSDSTINLGSGNDSLTARLVMSNSRLYGGDGDDSLNVLASVLDSFIDMGAGNDMVHIAGDLVNSILAMGEGEEDSVFIGGGASSSKISGVKDSNLWIMGKRADKY